SPEKFFVPGEVYDRFQDGIGTRGKALRDAWFAKIDEYKVQHPELADELYRMQHRQLPEGWDRDLPTFPADAKGLAGRAASSKVLNAVAANGPWFIGGSADLTPSAKARIDSPDAGDCEAGSYGGRNLHFGVRELEMGACLNGMALTKLRPFGS